MNIFILLLSVITIKFVNDINYLKNFSIMREDGTVFNEENTLTERIVLVLIYKYKLINLNIIRKNIIYYTKNKNKTYTTKSNDIARDINKFLRDNGVNSKYTTLKIISELSNFNNYCKKIKINEVYLTKIKEKLYNKIPLPITNNIINTYFRDNFITVNDFFTRKIDYVLHRPIYKTYTSKDAMEVVSSCDSRCLIYRNVTKDYTLLIKNNTITCEHLLKDCNINNTFFNKNISVCIFRLATVDYHYCHSPIECTIIDIFTIGQNSLFTVQPNITNLYDVYFKNNRHIIKMITPSKIIFYMLIIGAVGIDCIEYDINNSYTKTLPKLNTSYKKGVPICRFSYGGSTVILLFNHEITNWNKTITQNSLDNLETYIKVRSSYICSL